MAKFKISGNFIGALVFAFALWGYTSLNDSYITFVEVPLFIELPSDRAIENNVPSLITLELRGSGWDLFNLIFFNSAKICKVDLSTEKNLKDYSISRQEMIKSTEYLTNVETRDVLPTRIDLVTGRILEKKVDVRFVGELATHSDFIFTSEHKIQPQQVRIRGNENIIKDIEHWNTKPFFLKGLTRGSRLKVELSDSLASIIKKDIDFITLTNVIEQKAEIIVENVQLTILGHGSKNIKIQPSTVDVLLKGGLSELEKVDISKINAEITYKDIKNSSSGIIIPKLTSENQDIELELHGIKYLYVVNGKRSLK